MAGLEWAEAKHDSPYGRIESRWRIEDGRLRLEVEVPPGTEAVVKLADGREQQVGPGQHLFEDA